MKTLKFQPELVTKILAGEKTSTWRMDDDKDLQDGDELVFLVSDTGEEFARARVMHIRVKQLGDVVESDFEEGHERYKSNEDMLMHFRSYYGPGTSFNSILKIVKFELLK